MPPPRLPARTPSAQLPQARADDLVREFLSGRKVTTHRAYASALRDFATWAGVSSASEAARRLLVGSHGDANRTAHAYRANLVDRGASAATVNLRLAALRSMVKFARIQGLVPWTLEVAGMKAEPYRDTRGPGRVGVRAVLEATASPATPKGVRDRALVRLMADLALRRGELVALDVADVDIDGGTVAVRGKGRSGKVRITLPEPTRVALRAWLRLRGTDAGPLFGNFDPRNPNPGRPPQRLTGTSMHRIIRAIGVEAGLLAPLRPHGLRHAAITQALEVARGNIRAAQRFSRHADPRTLLVYDDAREDLAGEIAKRVADWG